MSTIAESDPYALNPYVFSFACFAQLVISGRCYFLELSYRPSFFLVSIPAFHINTSLSLRHPFSGPPNCLKDLFSASWKDLLPGTRSEGA